MEQIDILALGNELEFDIRKVNLKNSIISLAIIDENFDLIPGFESNKIILYNNNIDEKVRTNSIIQHMYNYVKTKNDDIKIHLVEINNKNNIKNVDVSLLIELCKKKKMFQGETNIKKIYKKCI